MIIKLEELNSSLKNQIEINENLDFDESYYNNTDIKNLKNVKVLGRIYNNSSNELILEGQITGTMILEDAISLDEVEYDFLSKVEEILKNNQNSIDILPILWQNIVLEIPLRFTKVEDYSKYSGDGWKLISEKKEECNNPFLEFSKNYKEE